MKLSSVALILAFATGLMAQTNPNTVPVKPTVKKDGTFVPAHVRTAPNQTQTDNAGSKGNVNPQTGKPGTKTPKK